MILRISNHPYRSGISTHSPAKPGRSEKRSARRSRSGRRTGSSTSPAAKPERQPLACFAVALALTVGLLIVPYCRSYYLVVLILPLIVLANMPQTRDRWLFALALFSFFLLP
jgi:hypothetical protein